MKTELQELLDSEKESDIKKGLTLEDNIKSLAKKYVYHNGDINLKTPIRLESRKSEVYKFYVYDKWIYLLDDMGNDIDPYDVDEEFLETFTDYISDERNVYMKK